MKQIPIIMTTDMVLATLDGEKCQTRRPLKVQFAPDATPCEVSATTAEGWQTNGHSGLWWDDSGACIDDAIKCPFGIPGDQLYVRETWQHSNWPNGPFEDSCEIFYRADYANDPHGFDGEKSIEGKYRFWNPSIHMPKSCARVFLRVDRVRIERVQAISYYDAADEGAMYWAQRQSSPVRDIDGGDTRLAFIALWESIYGPWSWEANPWVWVIDFTRVKP